MYCYFAYGLGIHSEIELPELAPTTANPDIVIRQGHLDFSDIDEMASGVFYSDADQARIRYDRIGAVAVLRGAEIIFDPEPNGNLDELRMALLGAVFGVLLHQRGLLVLHASVVARKNCAIAFLAEAGGGKSTTAAAMLTRGYQLVADDILALQPEPGHLPIVLPAFPFLKVSPQAARMLGKNLDAAPRVNTQLEKRVWKITDAPVSPVILNCIYVLDRGEQPRIEPLTAPESFIALVRHTFVARLLDSTNATQRHFQQCSILATQVPMCKLCVPSALDSLASLAELIDADFTRDLNPVRA